MNKKKIKEFIKYNFMHINVKIVNYVDDCNGILTAEILRLLIVNDLRDLVQIYDIFKDKEDPEINKEIDLLFTKEYYELMDLIAFMQPGIDKKAIPSINSLLTGKDDEIEENLKKFLKQEKVLKE